MLFHPLNFCVIPLVPSRSFLIGSYFIWILVHCEVLGVLSHKVIWMSDKKHRTNIPIFNESRTFTRRYEGFIVPALKGRYATAKIVLNNGDS